MLNILNASTTYALENSCQEELSISAGEKKCTFWKGDRGRGALNKYAWHLLKPLKTSSSHSDSAGSAVHTSLSPSAH